MSGITQGYTSLTLHGWAQVLGANPPTFAVQSGFISSVVHTGTGNWSFTLGADYAIDALQMLNFCSPRTAFAASGAVSIGVSNTSDTVKVMDVAQEAGGGGASTLVDTIDVNWLMLKVIA